MHGGEAGEWHVEQQRLQWEVLEAFTLACEKTGIPRVTDFNTGNNRGVGQFDVSQKSGTRLDTGRAFLNAAPTNLTVRSNVKVERLVLENNRAVGVQLEGGEVISGGEFVLCAGAIGSPGRKQKRRSFLFVSLCRKPRYFRAVWSWGQRFAGKRRYQVRSRAVSGWRELAGSSSDATCV
jgi:hypothetical protein